MWFYRRSDAYERNEWSNYTNWPTNIPHDVEAAEEATDYRIGDRGIGPAIDLSPSALLIHRNKSSYYT